jgi:Mn-dependent DtxR family transcriptional regulator
MLLTELLIGLGVEPEIAREDACKIEHDLSVESFDAIRRHAQEHR